VQTLVVDFWRAVIREKVHDFQAASLFPLLYRKILEAEEKQLTLF